MWHIHTIDCYSAMRKEDILPFATTGVDLEHIMLSEISQTEKEKYCMVSLYVESKKVKHKKTESQMVLTKGWG